jgi:hypothetical protein
LLSGEDRQFLKDFGKAHIGTVQQIERLRQLCLVIRGVLSSILRS